MRNIIKYFIQNPVLVKLGIGVLIILGLLRLSIIKTTSTPPAKIRSITIDVGFPGASPQEVEAGIIVKIEENLQGLKGIKKYTSDAKENKASLQIDLLDSADPEEVLADVQNAVDKINTFPDGMEEPIIVKKEPIQTVIYLVLNGNLPLQELKDYAERIRDDLIAYRGLSQVVISGYPEEEIEVSVRENDLQAYELTFEEIANAVRLANLEVTGGEIKTDKENIQIRARSKSYFAKDLKNLIIRATENGKVIRLKDVADVRDRFADTPSIRRFENKPSVLIDIKSRNEENVLEIANIVQDYVKTFNLSHAGTKIEVIADNTVNIKATRDTMLKNAVIGLVLVMIVLGLFLEKKLAFWVGLKIPIALLGMFALSGLFGLTINMVSIFGCILVLGILVDDGVVVAENIYQHAKEKGKSPLRAALDGTAEVMPPVFFSLLTTATAFCMFFFLPGQSGDFFGTISFVVCATLFVAMIESFFFLPAHIAHSNALNPENKQTKLERTFNNSLIRFRDKVYVPVVRFTTTKWKILVIAIFAVLLAITTLALVQGWVKLNFFPNLNQDIVTVNLELEPGTNELVTLQRLESMKDAVWRTNERLSKKRKDGRQVVQNVELSVGPESHKGELKVMLLGGEMRGISSKQMTDLIREETGHIPGAVKLTFGGGRDFGGRPVSVALYGNDIKGLRQVKDQLKEILIKRKDLKDIVDTDDRGLTEITVALKPQAELLGLSLSQVMQQVRNGFFGVEAQSLQRGDEEIKVWVRFGREERMSVKNLENMRIGVGDGNTYLLKDIANLEEGEGVLSIHHLDGKREIRVEADVANEKVSALEVVNEIQTEILPPILDKHRGVSLSLEGQNRESLEVIEAITVVGPVTLLAMLGLIIINFKSFSQMVVVLLTIPFALPGVVLGHWIHGVPLNIFSLIGAIALSGVLVNDSLVLVSGFNDRLRDGTPFYKALLEATRSRFRPILLTTVTTISGLIPMIANESVTAAILTPPALSIAYGLALGVSLPLVLLPTFLILNNRVKILWYRLWEGKHISPEEVEPAVKLLRHQIH